MQLATIALALFASATSTASGQPSNASVPLANNSVPLANASRAGLRYDAPYPMCYQPANAVPQWYEGSRGNGPYGCKLGEGRYWSMQNTYRAGGTEGVHWKYTDDPNDWECLYNWAYYDESGRGFIAYVNGRTTMQGSSRRWCALPVYRSGGAQGYHWEYCTCYEYHP